MAVVYKNAGLFTLFAIFALRDSGVKPLGFLCWYNKSTEQLLKLIRKS